MQSREFLDPLEQRTLMSASEIGIGPPPTEQPAAVVMTLSPQQTETGKPSISVTVNPPPVLSIPDKAPPHPPVSDFVVVKVVDKASP